jgi:hypothetical protein
MNSRTTRQFRQLFAALPRKVRKQARDAYRLFLRNPAHPGLHFKRVLDDPPTYSARVSLNYRAVAVLDGDTVVWYWIGTHADYDKLLKKF